MSHYIRNIFCQASGFQKILGYKCGSGKRFTIIKDLLPQCCKSHKQVCERQKLSPYSHFWFISDLCSNQNPWINLSFSQGGNKKIKGKIFTEGLSLNSTGDGGNKANRAVVLPGSCPCHGCSGCYPDLSAASEDEAGPRAGRAGVWMIFHFSPGGCSVLFPHQRSAGTTQEGRLPSIFLLLVIFLSCCPR